MNLFNNLLPTLRQRTDLLLKIAPDRFFIIVASIFGLLFIAITPPFQAPDEPAHFLRAYQVSQFNVSVDTIDGTLGGRLPASLGNTINYTMTSPDIAFHANYKYDIYKTVSALNDPEASELKVYDMSATASYGPLAYLPQAFGIGVARLFDLSPIVMMYFGRIMNLAVWVLLIALVIRMLPFKKWVMVFIGLLPMALAQASSLSSDTISVALTALFAAYVFLLVTGKKQIGRSSLLILLGLGVALCLTKQLTFLALPLLLLIPGVLLGSRFRAIGIKAGLIAIPLAVLAIWTLMSGGADGNVLAANGQNPSEQLKYVLLHPHSYINTLWNTYFFSWGDNVTRSVIGVFGWADAPLSELLVVVGYVSLIGVYLLNDNPLKTWLSRQQKIVLWAIVALYVLAVSTALYLFYSPVGYKIVYGLQGRYFIPVLIFLIPLLYGDGIKTSKKTYLKLAIGAPLFLLVASTITIYVRYYVNNV